MNCPSFHKYIVALADVQTEVRENGEALEHLNRCPSCARRVADLTGLKAALVRVHGEVRAPQHLRDRVLSSLEATQAGFAQAESEPLRRKVATGPRYRLMVPVAIAAALLLAVSLSWFPGMGETRAGTITVVTGGVVADAREQHRRCVSRPGADHHDASLPRDLAGIAQRLSSDLRLAVIAPDLRMHGFALVGADRCGILGLRGAHVLYRSDSGGDALSVFSVSRITTLGSVAPDSASVRHEYYVSADEPGEALSVVLWHDGPQSYVVCGDRPTNALLDVVDEVQVAGVTQPDSLTRPTDLLALCSTK